MNTRERFWLKVNRDGPIPEYHPELGPCWLWTGGTTDGYGRFHIPNPTPGPRQKSVRAHIYAYNELVGEVPEGLVIDHLCRVRCCVRPSHLEPVTPAENLARGTGFGSVTMRTGFCKRGHSFSGDNILIVHSGKDRVCKACSDIYAKEYKKRPEVKARKAAYMKAYFQRVGHW
jgi:hypothetical protein